jgi:peptide/nickel transport system substrate-binding protein
MAGGLSREECSKANLLYEHDLAKAKLLLAEAGFPNGFSLEVFTTESDSYTKAYELIQAQLRKAGIDLKLSVVDHSTFHTRIRQNLDPIVVYLSFRPNPDVILTQFFHSASVVATGKKPVTNFSHFGEVDADGDGKIDGIDDLIENARKEKDSQKQIAFWKEGQKRILQNMAAYPAISLGYLFAWKPHVDWGYKMVWVTDGPKATEQTQIVKK